jgi:hypothetical protein
VSSHRVTHVTVRNGLTLAYTIAFINAALALLVQFGVHLTTDQQTAITTFVNVSIVLAARVLHMPERTPAGLVMVKHEPILVTEAEPEPDKGETVERPPEK